MRLKATLYTFVLAALFLSGCSPKKETPDRGNPSTLANATLKPGIFEDATSSAGIHFEYTNGVENQFFMLETTPGGCAFLDYDNDGKQDVFFVQSGATPSAKSAGVRPHCALYHNLGGGKFEDVTTSVGLDKLDQGYAQGVVVGDYDNDSYPDLFITAYENDHLLHNDGKGHFVEVTKEAGLDRAGKTRWATSAAWGDFNKDGLLDLIVLHYAPWTPATNQTCKNTKGSISYCSPELYPNGEIPTLYQNNGQGRFVDVTTKVGLDKIHGRGLGVVFMDYDQDGWPDIYIACDLTPNVMLHSEQGKRFTNVATELGVAYGTDAATFSGMGVSVGDYMRTGWQSILVTNYSYQPNSLYLGKPGGSFQDQTYQSAIGEASLNFLAFGVEFLDYDNDGWLDVVVGNGHVDPFIDDIAANVTYKERKLLMHNLGNGKFADMVDDMGALSEPRVTRGLAVGDFDNDGKIDVLDNSHNLPARLYHNVGKAGNFVTLRLEGTKTNRDAVGTQVWATVQGKRQLIEVRNGSSYASTSDRRLHFGLGTSEKVEKIEVRWLSGEKQVFMDVKANGFYYLKEGGSLAPDPRVK